MRAVFCIGLLTLVAGITVAAVQSRSVDEPSTSLPVSATPSKVSAKRSAEKFDGSKVAKTDMEWRKLLTPDQFAVLREKGTEQPYSGEYDKNKKAGTYHCAACDLALFSSKSKFDSGTGWPSFYQAIFASNVDEETDRSLGEVRVEVMCKRCGGHLGHVFDDGPAPTGLRYCINSIALKFKPAK